MFFMGLESLALLRKSTIFKPAKICQRVVLWSTQHRPLRRWSGLLY